MKTFHGFFRYFHLNLDYTSRDYFQPIGFLCFSVISINFACALELSPYSKSDIGYCAVYWASFHYFLIKTTDFLLFKITVFIMTKLS